MPRAPRTLLRLLDGLLPWGLGLAFALAATRPGALRLPTHAIGVGHMDMQGHLWAGWNASRDLAYAGHSPLNFHPDGQDLLVVHGGHLDVLLSGLLIRAGLPVATAYNLVLVGYLALAFAGGWVLARALTGSRAAAAVGGLALAFQPFLFRMAAQGLVEEVAVGLLALTLAAALGAAARPGPQGPLTLAAGVVATTVACWEYGMFLAGAMLVYGASVLAGLDRAARPGAIRRLTAGCALASAALLPLVLPFLRRQAAHRDALVAGWPEVAEARSPEGLILQQGLSVDEVLAGAPEGPYLLWPVVLLAAAALPGRWRRQGPLLVLALSFAALALGPRLKVADALVTLGGEPVPLPLAALLDLLPFLGWFYWPHRLLSVAAVALAGLAALGVARLGRRLPGGAPLAATAGAAALLWHGSSLQSDVFPRLPAQRLPEVPAAYGDCLAGIEPGAVLEAPIPTFGLPLSLGRPPAEGAEQRDLRLNGAQHRYRWYQVSHGRPLLGGVDVPHAVPAAWRRRALDEPTLRMLALASQGEAPRDPPPPGARDSLRALGVSAVLVHSDDYDDAAVAGAVRRWLQRALGRPACRDRRGGITAFRVDEEPAPAERSQRIYASPPGG